LKICLDEELKRLESVRKDLKVSVKSVSENALGEASSVLIGTAETKDEWGAIQEQLNNYNALMAHKGKSSLPDPQCPYFGRITLEEPGHQRDVLIGYGTLVGSDIYQPIVDWKKAPVGKLFFKVRSGDEFEQELPKRLSRGVVVRRWLYGIKNGSLESIWSDSGKRIYRHRDQWLEQELSWIIPLQGGEGKSVRQIDPTKIWNEGDEKNVKDLLDEDQRKVLDAPPNESLLILGGAGSGKTTIALLRVAKFVKHILHQQSPNRVLVLVPHQGLKNLCLNILFNMNVLDVPVLTYDEWVAGQGLKIFQNLPNRICPFTPDSVVKIKRSRRMLEVLQIYIHREYLAVRRELQKILPEISEKLLIVEMKAHETLIRAYDRLQTRAIELSEQQDRKAISQFFAKVRRDLYDFRKDRIDIFSDRLLMAELKDENEKITERMIGDLVNHSRAQFHNSYVDLQLQEDVDNHIALDGRDETTEDIEDLYNSIDVEDFTILFHLLLKKTGEVFMPKGPAISKVAHMVLDEAQELSEGELKILGYCLEKNGAVTISGDEGQLTTSDDCFQTWDKVLESMGLATVSRSRLMTNYRSTRAVADLGMHVLKDLAREMPIAVRDGLPVFRSHYDSLGMGLSCLSATVRDLIAREEVANIAIIVREEKTARMIHHVFEDCESVRIILDGRFKFDPGIDITTIDEIKGLEFDYVIIPDAHSFVYREDNLSRRAFYVAITRAVYGLWIYSTSTQSTLLSDWKPAEESFMKWLSPVNSGVLKT